MSPLLSEEKRVLLAIARSSIESAISGNLEASEVSFDGNLATHAGAFVTLRLRGRLRGCIGRLMAEEPLASVVAQCAIAAANEDPRFRPLQSAELIDVRIEISVLSKVAIVRPEEVTPGVHGVVIARGDRRGVLLPGVAMEHHWGRERFLEETCLKGGLDPNAWTEPDTHIGIFTAEVFSESDTDASGRRAQLSG